MSSKRPGTVDYSHFDNIDCSDDDSSSNDNDNDSERERMMRRLQLEQQQQRRRTRPRRSSAPPPARSLLATTGGGAPSTTTNGNSSTSTSARPTAGDPSLATLQRAWGTTATTTTADAASTSTGTTTTKNPNTNTTTSTSTTTTNETTQQQQQQQQPQQQEPQAPSRLCAHCAAPNPPFRCSRCHTTWFCNVSCQRSHHPVHQQECVDAASHFAYWGIFQQQQSQQSQDNKNNNTNISREAKEKALLARQMAKRRRALQRAAAAAAVERARLAREARGAANKQGGGGKGKGQNDREETCAICQCEFTVSGDGGVGLCCPGSHYMCAECAGVYVKSVVGDLETSFPPRCPMCRVEYSRNHFERQLTSAQQVAFQAFAARKALKPGQDLMECHECGGFQVVTGGIPVLWWCPHCDTGICNVCKKDLPSGVQKYDILKSPHASCLELRVPKALVEEAIERGSKMTCPGCGLAGRKDDACTHMTCMKCETVWCYVCGLNVKDCDKAAARRQAAGRPVDDIFLHNQDWETNEKRCPMYLTQILEVDLDWLGDNWEENARDEDFEDDEKCLDHFHRFQTIRKLQGVRSRVGPDLFKAVFENFDSVKNAGYGLDEIISTSTDKLIDRSGYIRHLEDEQASEQDSSEEEDEEEDDEVVDEDEEDDMEDEEMFQTVPPDMTRAVLEEEENIRQAIDRSIATEQEDVEMRQQPRSRSIRRLQDEQVAEQDSMEEADEEEDEEVFETVPPEMTRAVLDEQENMRRAIDRSIVTEQQDEEMRQAVAASLGEDDA